MRRLSRRRRQPGKVTEFRAFPKFLEVLGANSQKGPLGRLSAIFPLGLHPLDPSASDVRAIMPDVVGGGSAPPDPASACPGRVVAWPAPSLRGPARPGRAELAPPLHGRRGGRGRRSATGQTNEWQRASARPGGLPPVRLSNARTTTARLVVCHWSVCRVSQGEADLLPSDRPPAWRGRRGLAPASRGLHQRRGRARTRRAVCGLSHPVRARPQTLIMDMRAQAGAERPRLAGRTARGRPAGRVSGNRTAGEGQERRRLTVAGSTSRAEGHMPTTTSGRPRAARRALTSATFARTWTA